LAIEVSLRIAAAFFHGEANLGRGEKRMAKTVGCAAVRRRSMVLRIAKSNYFRARVLSMSLKVSRGNSLEYESEFILLS
jgi:hypothetical protein